MNTDLSHGCGSGACACAASPARPAGQARINGIALHHPDEALGADELLERAHGELLRQEAVRQGRLPALDTPIAPELDEVQREAIEALLEQAVATPVPSPEACRRYYDGHRPQFVVGQALHVRHILFAVTPGVDVQALARRAEQALLELSHAEAPADRFAVLARELSNCPSGAHGGDLGWIGPEDCAPELAQAFFFQNEAAWPLGLHPRLVHSRYGLHIIDVLGQRPGESLAFDAVQERIARQLAMQSRATALRQYMKVLIGQARIEGLDLEGADTPLVQ